MLDQFARTQLILISTTAFALLPCSPYNTTLGILYMTQLAPTRLPTTVYNAQPPHMSPDEVGPDYVNPYFQHMRGRPTPPPANKVKAFAS